MLHNLQYRHTKSFCHRWEHKARTVVIQVISCCMRYIPKIGKAFNFCECILKKLLNIILLHLTGKNKRSCTSILSVLSVRLYKNVDSLTLLHISHIKEIILVLRRYISCKRIGYNVSITAWYLRCLRKISFCVILSLF